MSIYAPLQNRLAVLAAIEANEGELTPELEEQLTVSDDRITEATLELLAVRQVAETQIMGAEAEMERLREHKQALLRGKLAIDRQLLAAVQRLGTIAAGTYTVKATTSTAVLLADDALVPQAYCKYVPPVPERWQPDKVALGKALRAGEAIEGAVLEHRVNLHVK